MNLELFAQSGSDGEGGINAEGNAKLVDLQRSFHTAGHVVLVPNGQSTV